MQNSQLGAGDWADIITALVASVGILLAYLELRRNTRVQRGQFLMDVTERYFADSEARRLFYDIDYNQFEIHFIGGRPATVVRGNQEGHPFIGSEEERSLDNLLYTFDVIGRLVELDSLSMKEAEIFAFQAKRVLRNESVQQYAEWVNGERARIKVKAKAHQAAFRLAAQFEERDREGMVRNA
jgi:hypothetical protein